MVFVRVFGVSQGRPLSLASVLRAFLEPWRAQPCGHCDSMTHSSFREIVSSEKFSQISGAALGSLLALLMALNKIPCFIFLPVNLIYLSEAYTVMETISNPFWNKMGYK